MVRRVWRASENDWWRPSWPSVCQIIIVVLLSKLRGLAASRALRSEVSTSKHAANLPFIGCATPVVRLVPNVRPLSDFVASRRFGTGPYCLASFSALTLSYRASFLGAFEANSHKPCHRKIGRGDWPARRRGIWRGGKGAWVPYFPQLRSGWASAHVSRLLVE